MKNFSTTLDNNILSISQLHPGKFIFTIILNSYKAEFGKNMKTGEWKFSAYEIGFPQIEVDFLSKLIEENFNI